VTGTNQFNCSSTAVVNVSDFPQPNITALAPQAACKGDLVLIDGQGGVSYKFISSSSYQTSNPANVILQGPVQFTVVGTDANGCEGSTILTIAEMDCTGLNEIAGSNVRVYPNPTSGAFTIELDAAEANVQVMDVTGRVVVDTKATGGTINVNISDLSNGVYTVKVQGNDAMDVIRVIKD
jgi:hypothetical protein